MAEMLGILGPPKTGKSHFARSCAEIGKTVIALCDPTERNFYKQSGLEPEIVVDHRWRPFFDQYDATGFDALMRWLDKVAESDAEFIVIDPASAVSDLVMHEVLKLHHSDDPKSAGGYGEGYTGHNRLMNQFLTELQLANLKDKWVICTWHTRMKEMEGAGEVKKGKGMSGKEELQFEERLLPVINTSMRQDIAGFFSGWLHTKLYGYGPGTKYCLTAVPDQARPAGSRLQFKKGTNLGMIPNTMKSLLEVLET